MVQTHLPVAKVNLFSIINIIKCILPINHLPVDVKRIRLYIPHCGFIKINILDLCVYGLYSDTGLTSFPIGGNELLSP